MGCWINTSVQSILSFFDGVSLISSRGFSYLIKIGLILVTHMKPQYESLISVEQDLFDRYTIEHIGRQAMSVAVGAGGDFARVPWQQKIKEDVG
jgi:hypothetical protein